MVLIRLGNRTHGRMNSNNNIFLVVSASSPLQLRLEAADGMPTSQRSSLRDVLHYPMIYTRRPHSSSSLGFICSIP